MLRLRFCVLLALILVCAKPIKSQIHVMHEVGGIYAAGQVSNEFLKSFEACYAPRIQADLGEKSGIALSVKPAASLTGWAFGMAFGDGTGGIDLPIMLEFHNGLGTHKSTGEKAGFYLGAGFNAALLSRIDNRQVQEKMNYGPAAELGLRFRFTGIPISLRMKYMYSLPNGNPHLFGLGLMYMVGVK